MASKSSKSRGAETNIRLKPSEVKNAVAELADTGVSSFIWGPPGIGKSQILKQLAKEMDANFVDVRLSQLDPTDLRGIPYPAREFDIEKATGEASKVASQISANVLRNLEDSGIDVNDEKNHLLVNNLVTSAVQESIKGVMQNSGTNTMYWAPPSFYQRDHSRRTVYLFDEINTAAQSNQAAAYQIVLDRRLGDYVLGPDDVVIAAGNRETDKGATFKMPTPLLNRFVHLEMREDFEDWQNWALMNQVHKDVVGYLTFQKQELFEFEPSSASRGFPTPRSWEFVSKLLYNNPNTTQNVLTALISGAVGDGVGVKFIQYRKHAAELPNPSDILTGKVKTLNSKETSVMYALTVGLCYELKDAYDRAVQDKDKKKALKEWHKMGDNFFKFLMSEFKDEMCILGARTALASYGLPFDPNEMECWEEFSGRFMHLILNS